MTFNENIGNILRTSRKNKKLSCQEMADFLHCSKSAYANYERGKYSIPMNHFIQCCEHLGIDWTEAVKQARQ